MFTHLYLDSEPLRGSRWPNISVELSNLLRLARRLEVNLNLPVAVEMELEAQYMRDFRELHQTVEGKLKSHLRRAGLDDALALRSDEELLAAYRAAAASSRGNEGLQSVPLSAWPASDYFDLLLKRDPPFSQDGRGFGDAVILLSVVDHIRTIRDASGVIISADRRFGEAGRLTARLGVELEILSLDAAYKKMIDELSEILGQRFAADYVALLTFVQGHADEIKAYVARNVAFPAISLGFLFTTPESVDEIESVQIERVITEPELWRQQLEPGQQLTIRIAARARVLVTVRSWPAGPTRILRIGQEAEEMPAAGSLESSTNQRTIEREIEIDATVLRVDHATYTDLRLRGARLKDTPTGLAGLRAVADG